MIPNPASRQAADQQRRDAARYLAHESQHPPESPARLGWRELRLIAEQNARVLEPQTPTP